MNQDRHDKFFYTANKIDQANELLKANGFSKEFIVKASNAFLGLMLVESRIKRSKDALMKHINNATPHQPIEPLLELFTEEDQGFILEAFQSGFLSLDIMKLKQRFQVNIPNKELEVLMIALLWKIEGKEEEAAKQACFA